MKRSGALLALFFAASLVEVLIPYESNEIVHFISKPLILISLIGFYLSNVKTIHRFFVAALVACLAGDTCLLLDERNPSLFMVGLICFLIAHVLLIVAYRQQRIAEPASKLVQVQKARLSFPVILAGTGLIVYLYPHLGKMTIPVLLYSTVLIIMVVSAISRLGRSSRKSFWFVFAGACLFMISDSVLAVNKFAAPVPYSNVLIMSAYCSALFLIVCGILAYADGRTPA